MKVLVACEFSGIVRDAFAAKGHDAWSCDLLPTESARTKAEGKHIQGDVLEVIKDYWDLMVAHPPCTKLAYVANGQLKKDVARGGQREHERALGMEFFLKLANAEIKKKCLENPLGWPCLIYRRQDQIIHPYEFGDPVRKRICLWLKGLPPLFCTEIRNKPRELYRLSNGKKVHFTDSVTGKDRGKIRSVFFPGIAAAMAEQWSW